jgi:hypothetical protein
LGKYIYKSKKEGKEMEVNMSVEEVVNQISALVEKEGKPPRKKEVKKSDPELMKNALYYFPSWDTAVEHSIGS